MRALIFSDSHGNLSPMLAAARLHPEAQAVFFLGDGLRDFERFCELSPGLITAAVSGNNDPFGGAPGELRHRFGGKLLFMIHGHRYGVKRGIDAAVDAAVAAGADILLFGHTHVPLERTERGLYVLNPGSIGLPYDGKPSYGILDVTSAGVSLFSARL